MRKKRTLLCHAASNMEWNESQLKFSTTYIDNFLSPYILFQALRMGHICFHKLWFALLLWSWSVLFTWNKNYFLYKVGYSSKFLIWNDIWLSINFILMLLLSFFVLILVLFSSLLNTVLVSFSFYRDFAFPVVGAWSFQGSYRWILSWLSPFQQQYASNYDWFIYSGYLFAN